MKQSETTSQTSEKLKQSRISSKILEDQTKDRFDRLKKQMLDDLNKTQCQYKYAAKLACSSKECEHPKRFACYDSSCKCRNNHKYCKLIQTKYLHENIISNLKNTQELLIKVDSIFNSIIDTISQKKIDFINQLIFDFGLTANEIYYKNILTKKTQLSNLLQYDIVPSIIKQKQTLPHERIKKMSNKLKQQMQYVQKFIKLQSIRINEQIEKYCETVSTQYFNSRIIQTSDQKQFLYWQLKKSLSLLYRASQNNFQLDSFKEKCHLKSNLLVLVKNQKNKKYGAFTPCKYNKDQDNVYRQDNSLKSFLFSISDKLKFKLIKKQYAMNNSSDNLSPILSFGQLETCCMAISPQANQSKSNWFKPGSAYQQNAKFVPTQYVNSEDIHSSYRLLQYEVYQVKQHIVNVQK